MIHWDSSGSATGLRSNVGIERDLILKTDNRGSFSADMPPGFYDVFVSSRAFTPQCGKVHIKEGQVTVYSTKLAVDLLIIRELGDTFN